jgi:hypothetical protein
MINTVRAADPFVAANAGRLQTIAWALLALQILSMVIAAIAKAVAREGRPIDIDAGFSLNGWVAVLLTFVLARVFAEGARDPLLDPRDDLRDALVSAGRRSSIRAAILAGDLAERHVRLASLRPHSHLGLHCGAIELVARKFTHVVDRRYVT